MKNGLYSSPNASQPLTSITQMLVNPVQVDGATLFRHTVYLLVPVDEFCQQVSLAPEASLTVQFSAADVPVRHNSQAWNLSPWNYDNLRVSVDLALPIRVHRLDSNGYRKAALHRMDGDTLIEEATAIVSTNQVLSEEFSASRFAVVLSSPGERVRSAPHSAGGVHAAPKVKKKVAAAAGAGNHVSVHEEEMSAMVAAMEAIYAGTLDAIRVQGQPTSPRLRLISHGSVESLWQWLEFPGVQTETRSVSVTAELLQPALDRAFALREPGQTQLVLPLHIESDAPCNVSFSAQQFRFVREANVLPDGEPVVLRFSGQRQETQSFTLQAPAVEGQQLLLTLSVAQRDQALPSQPLPALESLPRSGFRLQTGDHLAAPLDLVAGQFIRGFALPWWPLDAEGRLGLSVLADQGGTPGGHALATAELRYSEETPRWLMFTWDEVMLQPGHYWLQLAVEDGSGLWLADNGACKVHKHFVHATPEALEAPHTPVRCLLGSRGAADSESETMTLELNGVKVALQSEGERRVATVQQLPQKPWIVGITAIGGAVTVNVGKLVY